MMAVYAAKVEQDAAQAKPLSVVQVSKAPPPITPIRGTGITVPARKAELETPTWREWEHIPEVQAWQACALSMNIDPHSVAFDRFDQEHAPVTDDEAVKAEFALRQRVLLANIHNCTHFSPCAIVRAKPNVRLSEFAVWAVSVVKWPDPPPSLVNLAQAPGKQKVAPAEQSEPRTGNTTTHSLGTRSNILNPIIDAAKKTAAQPDQPQSVWAELVTLAELKNPQPPLIGYSSDGIQYRGKRYEKTGEADVLTSKNLRDRMKRERAKTR